MYRPNATPTITPSLTPPPTNTPTPTPTLTPASAAEVSLSAVTLNGQAVDQAGIIPLNLHLPGEAAAPATFELPLVLNYSSGSPRYLLVKFKYDTGAAANTANTFDLGAFFTRLQRGNTSGATEIFDFNKDGVVNSMDYAIMRKEKESTR